MITAAAVATSEPPPPSPHRRTDCGFSLTELVVTISLMGLVVSAVLAGLRVAVTASGTDRDQAVAFAWLHAASDEIYRSERIPCSTDGEGRNRAIATYTDAATRATPPPAWTGAGGAPLALASIRVVDVEYLGRIGVDDVFDWGPDFCFEGAGYADSPLYTQRVTVEVVFPDGVTTQTLEMVKSER